MLGRTELDEQASGPQVVSVEDGTGCIHGSQGRRAPASAICDPSGDRRRHRQGDIAAQSAGGLGRLGGGLRPRPRCDRRDLSRIFHDMSRRMWEPGGFHRPTRCARQEWNTRHGQGELHYPGDTGNDIDMPIEQRDIVQLITLRSNDQFNTTIYGYNDRFRGIHGTRMVVLMHRNDMARFGLKRAIW